MPSSRGGGLSFTLFGFPVTISLSLILLLAFIGANGSTRPASIALWVVVGVFSILLHELGHAVVARLAGSSPIIRLAGLGGVTAYPHTEKTQQRLWALGISLAGPFIGIILGLVAIAFGAPNPFTPTTVSSYGEEAAFLFVFMSLAWGALNLLPILPLDGGQALMNVLPGDTGHRRVLAAKIGIVVGIAVVIGAFMAGQPFAAIVVGLMTYQNVRTIQAGKQAGDLKTLVEQGKFGEARARVDKGEWDPTGLAFLQESAHRAGHFQTSAEVGETALARGYEHWVFPLWAAASWARLGATDRAMALVERAAAMDVPRDRLLATPDLSVLGDLERWQVVVASLPPAPTT